MTQRILIAGGTGFVGRHLIPALQQQGYALSVLTRQPNVVASQDALRYYRWDPKQQYIDPAAFEQVATIINLTGANIGAKRWTARRKKEILDSRVKTLDLLCQYCRQQQVPLHTLISSSGTGYYGAVTTNTIFKEDDAIGQDFLAQVCREWENAAQQFSTLGTRVVILRKGIVMGHGGAYERMAPLARRGINVALGSGQQYMSWISIEDLVRLYLFLLQHPEIKGVYNTTASEPITMQDFAQQLLQSFNKKTLLPNAPAWLVRILLGEMATALLEGSRVSNEKLRLTGFVFQDEPLAAYLKKLASPIE